MTVATRGVRSHVYYGMTRSLCRTCRQVVDARILFEDGRAWLDKFCLDHGAQRALAGSSAEWYADALKFAAPVVPPSRPATRVRRGCPLDCGPCPSHAAAFEICVLPALRGGRAEIPAAADGAVVRLAADDVLRRPELPETCRKAGFRRAVACAGSLDDARALAGAGIDMVLSVEDAAPDLLEVVGLLQEGGAIVTVRAKVPPRPEILRRLLDAVLSGPRAFSLELQVAPPTTIPDVHEEIRSVTEGR
ncbi:MAG: hypothetical protein HYY17_07460, partial [Planctomycetes bacterium]|nr:hypothetical protein [Planctomycetota bacterium]